MVKAFAYRADELKVPRTLVVRHPMGRPMGAPSDVERQTQVLRSALDLLKSATENGAIVELPEAYRPTPTS